MPINLYKGETQNNENKIGLDNDLYNNSGLWSKLAYFYYVIINSQYRDLYYGNKRSSNKRIY